MTDITLTPAQFQTLLDLLGTADTGEQEYQLTMNLTAKLLLLRMSGGGAPAPVASFTVLNDYATSVLTVDFTDTSTNTPTSWLWDFGDGNTSTSQNPTHTYAAAGHYDVTLTATNAGGSSAPVVVNVPVNAFEAALITAGFPRIYQYRETSGTTATNTGSDGILGVGTYVGSPVLGQADATGNPDAWSYDTIGQQVTLAAKTLTSCTIVALITAVADAPFTGLLYGQNASSQIILNTSDGGAGSLNLVVDIGTGQTFLVSDPFMTAGNTYLLFARYNHATGVMEIRYSDDGTIKTPSIQFDSSPVASPVALGNLTTLYAGGGYDPLTGDVKMGATAFISSFLNDAALLPIAAAVFP